jgi:hypothetical protein
MSKGMYTRVMESRTKARPIELSELSPQELIDFRQGEVDEYQKRYTILDSERLDFLRAGGGNDRDSQLGFGWRMMNVKGALREAQANLVRAIQAEQEHQDAASTVPSTSGLSADQSDVMQLEVLVEKPASIGMASSTIAEESDGERSGAGGQIVTRSDLQREIDSYRKSLVLVKAEEEAFYAEGQSKADDRDSKLGLATRRGNIAGALRKAEAKLAGAEQTKQSVVSIASGPWSASANLSDEVYVGNPYDIGTAPQPKSEGSDGEASFVDSQRATGEAATKGM